MSCSGMTGCRTGRQRRKRRYLSRGLCRPTPAPCSGRAALRLPEGWRRARGRPPPSRGRGSLATEHQNERRPNAAANSPRAEGLLRRSPRVFYKAAAAASPRRCPPRGARATTGTRGPQRRLLFRPHARPREPEVPRPVSAGCPALCPRLRQDSWQVHADDVSSRDRPKPHTLPPPRPSRPPEWLSSPQCHRPALLSHSVSK